MPDTERLLSGACRWLACLHGQAHLGAKQSSPQTVTELRGWERLRAAGGEGPRLQDIISFLQPELAGAGLGLRASQAILRALFYYGLSADVPSNAVFCLN